MDLQTAREALLSFLSEPLSETDGIFSRFSQLPGAVYVEGKKPNQRYLFVPGKNENPVLLTAHVDTVWDKNYKGVDRPADFDIKESYVVSKREKVGIGADDRAGCAALWLLRDSGNSLLLIDGEENSHIGASFLTKNRKLLKRINDHAFIMSFDLWGKDGYMFHAVKNPKCFADLLDSAGYNRHKEDGGSDIFYLCKKAAGVNVSIGYQNEHKATETVSIEDFYHCVCLAENLLKSVDRKYKIPILIRIYKFIRHRIALIVKPIIRKIKKRT
ncbi:MAG: hypothetical protein J5766_01005 [Clostridia bacterium]|nr:hypothetical protein [Clostridia bacterium]